MLSATFTSLSQWLGNSWGFPPLLKFFSKTEDGPQGVVLCPYSKAGIWLASFFPADKTHKAAKEGKT